MKILWLCNTPLPEAAKRIGLSGNSKEGWLIGISNQLRHYDNIQLVVLFPQNKRKRNLDFQSAGIEYYGYYAEEGTQQKVSGSKIQYFKEVIQKEKPDIIHIFGTEYIHSLEMLLAAHNHKVVISIQGLVSVYARHYLAGISGFESRKLQLINGKIGKIADGKRDFEERGKNEYRVIKRCSNVIGRTDWDYICTNQINPKCQYYHCNEILRDSFYSGKWSLEEVERHSVFLSQGNYPVKGLHMMLNAMKLLVKEYPDIHLYVGGSNNFIKEETMTPYGRYIKKKMETLHLKDKVTFVGMLSEQKMKERYLASHVFVMSSLIENSPNSLGEAMMLGMPCIASFVGGVGSMLQHKEEGYLYQADAPYMLAGYIKEIFSKEEKTYKMANAAREKSKMIFDREKNIEQLMNIYKSIYE